MVFSKVLPAVARVLLGGLFFVSGANKLVPFMPMPPLEPAAGAFMAALAATGYMFTLLGAVELVFGALLVAGRFVPLALTVLAPVVVNVVLFHVLLAPAFPIAAFLLGSEIYLAWVYRDAFVGLLRSTRPAAASNAEVRARTALAS